MKNIFGSLTMPHRFLKNLLGEPCGSMFAAVGVGVVGV